MGPSARQLLTQALVALVVVAGVSAAALQSCQARERAKQFQGDESFAPVFIGPSYRPGPDIVVTVNGSTFSLPRRYARVAQVGERAGFTVIARWPEMEGVTPETEAEFAYSSIHQMISIGAESSPRAVREYFEGHLRIQNELSVGPTEEHATEIGLSEFRAVGFRAGSTHNIGRKDYFVPTEELTVPVHIYCGSPLGRMPGRRSHQICTEITTFDDFLMEIHYDRDLLAQWREIHMKAASLLQRFRMAEGGNTTPTNDADENGGTSP